MNRGDNAATHRVRVKICGVTRQQDALACAEHGADAVGLVFYPPSPRHLEPAVARDIVAALPPFVSVVGLFLNPAADAVERVLSAVRLDALQFHGDEDAAFCRGFGIPYFKAVAMGDDEGDGMGEHAPPDFAQLRARFIDATAFLLDSHSANHSGGSGRPFDWSRIPPDLGKPLILAGGLTPANVQAAIARAHPYAVDCSSGVECRPGVKDPDKIRQFMENVAYVAPS